MCYSRPPRMTTRKTWGIVAGYVREQQFRLIKLNLEPLWWYVAWLIIIVILLNSNFIASIFSCYASHLLLMICSENKSIAFVKKNISSSKTIKICKWVCWECTQFWDYGNDNNATPEEDEKKRNETKTTRRCDLEDSSNEADDEDNSDGKRRIY